MSAGEIFSQKKLRAQILKTAIQTIQYWQSKYQSYSELTPIFKAIKQTKKKLRLLQ